MTSSKHTITIKSSFIPYSLLSGTFASLASVFAKLFTDTKTLSIAQYFCDVFSGGKNAKFCKEIEESGKGWENAILGNVIFGEALALQWWFGAGFIVLGTVLVNRSSAT
ncbi:17347_t:CDS:2, partial [Cetraspora pellucida]